MSALDYLSTIVELNRLRAASLNLTNLAETQNAPIASSEFSDLITEFEKEVDRLNILLKEQFGDDPEIMQLIFELKSAVIALRAENVERKPEIVEITL